MEPSLTIHYLHMKDSLLGRRGELRYSLEMDIKGSR